jgi:magnesium-transporting ATPase (P-type)
MVHFFALLLWVAGVLAFVAGMPALGVAIFVVVVINGTFAFVQEERAERAAERLADLMPVRVTVRREGQTEVVDADEVVVGDVVLLNPGDRIAADLTVVESHDLRVDESMLTGESVPVVAAEGATAFAGTFVVTGEGVGQVATTGARTRLAGIAALTAGVRRPKSPLAGELERVVRAVAGIALGVGLAFFGCALLLDMPARDGFLFAVGVTVALVPEGLLPTVTLSLAMGAQRMADRNALVRHLEAVETLGSTTVVCTDKTGTLTRNEMNAVRVWTPDGEVAVHGEGYGPEAEVDGTDPARARAARAALAATACVQGRAERREGRWIAIGDPMEAALDALAHRLGAPAAPAVRRRFAFDPVRRRSSVATDDAVLVLGAPDAVLPRCRAADGAADALSAMAASGLRVVASAVRPVDGPPDRLTQDTAEADLDLLGLIGLQDPPRPGVEHAVATCRASGIRLVMLTGDHPATGAAIARQVGLAVTGSPVLTGAELPEDDDDLADLLAADGVVIARVAPEDKLRIARVLQDHGDVVAMTGDGVNDGPALREADIGVAMGQSGTDVAREAADLVLLDDDFATIVAAISQGRATFSNIRRFLTYHLTDNVAELTPFVIWALSGGRFPLALGVLQILCLDIGTDLLPALALGAEPPTERAIRQPLGDRHLIDGVLARRVFGVLGPAEAGMEMLAFVVAFLAAGWRPGETFPTGGPLLAASGAAFAAVVFGQLGNAFACRSATVTPWRLGWTGNRLLLGAVLAELVALAGFLLVPPVADLLDHAPPPAVALLVAAGAAPAVLAADAAHKAVRARRRAARG